MIIERTKNTLRNSFWGFVNKVVMLFFPFIIRTIIIKTLGTEYAGLHSLFTSIISVLSLAELGFGSAIIYSMYKPIADNDNEAICALMNLYKKVYHYMGIAVLGISVILIPFLSFFITGAVPDDINIYTLYFIYILNSVVSYWLFAYKNCLLTAFQRNDIATNISTVLNLLLYIAQIILLLVTKNYYCYVICIPLFSIAINIVTALYTDKKYPQFKCKGEVDKKEKKEIKKQVIGLLAQRLALSSRNSFDSIIISAYLGLVLVGIYNNYFYILNAVTAFLALIFTSMQAGIGNSIAKESIEKNFNDIKKIRFLYMWISGWCTVCIFILTQPFMKIWVGSELMFSDFIVAILAFYFYAMKMTDTGGAYISATGNWWRCKYTYLFEAMVNLILNLVLGYFGGIIGVIVATIISVLFVNYICNIWILFKYYFVDKNLKEYILEEVKYMLVTFCVSLVIYVFTKWISFGSSTTAIVAELGIKFLICCIGANLLFMFFYKRDQQYNIAIGWLNRKVFKGRFSKLL